MADSKSRANETRVRGGNRDAIRTEIDAVDDRGIGRETGIWARRGSLNNRIFSDVRISFADHAQESPSSAFTDRSRLVLPGSSNVEGHSGFSSGIPGYSRRATIPASLASRDWKPSIVRFLSPVRDFLSTRSKDPAPRRTLAATRSAARARRHILGSLIAKPVPPMVTTPRFVVGGTNRRDKSAFVRIGGEDSVHVTAHKATGCALRVRHAMFDPAFPSSGGRKADLWALPCPPVWPPK